MSRLYHLKLAAAASHHAIESRRADEQLRQKTEQGDGKYTTKERLKDMGVTAIGAGLGAGAGYLAMRAVTDGEYGRALRNLSPNTRLKYLIPISTAITGGLAISHMARSKERYRLQRQAEKRAHIEDRVYRSLWGRV